jgi:hypothetical protein
MSWFQNRLEYFGRDLCAGEEFILPEYGVYIRPRHVAILVVDSKIVYHGTRGNVGFTQVGAVAFTKMKVVSAAKRRSKLVGFE